MVKTSKSKGKARPRSQKKSQARQKRVDPHRAREAAKYDKPIPSREFIIELLKREAKALTKGTLETLLGLEDDEQKEALRRRLRAMERDGQILRDRRKHYRLVDKMDLIRGRVQGHKDGFGFIIPDEGGDDAYLTAREMRKVFHGDKVLACKDGQDNRGRTMGRIVEVLVRNTEQIVGRFHRENDVSFVISDNIRISQAVLIMPKDCMNAKPGQIVTVEITMQPSLRNQPMGRVMEVLGDHMAPGMEIDVALRSHAVPYIWPREVEEEVAPWKSTKTLPKKAIEGRVDCRALPLVTIDGEDAKDFDDAVFAEPRARGSWKLYVAIADVSYYVTPDSALDKEALNRGTSVYFPSEVIPMLPEVLSNGWCSLKPGVDRLAMVCEMSISSEGKLSRYEFYEAVIRSHARLTYNEVAGMISGKDKRAKTRYAGLLETLRDAHQLFKLLLKSRKVRGAIDFDLPETAIIFGKDRKIEKIVPRVRNDAHRLIEEFMLMANVAAARFLKKSKVPAVYRIHEPPAADRLEEYQLFLADLGVNFKTDGKQPEDFARLIKRLQKRDDYSLTQVMMLRTMSQALYSTDNVGHFGLAFNAYTHFTSPIRRYPDLLVHRLIRFILQGKTDYAMSYTQAALHNMAESSSAAERRADDASRDVAKWLKCEYMLDKVESEFDGIISGVTSFGLFVELGEIYVDGLVHISSLGNDYYNFDAGKHCLIGERTSQIYKLGDPVRVRVVRVDLDERTIDFELVRSLKASVKKSRPAKTSSTGTAKKHSAKRSGKRTRKQARG